MINLVKVNDEVEDIRGELSTWSKSEWGGVGESGRIQGPGINCSCGWPDGNETVPQAE